MLQQFYINSTELFKTSKKPAVHFAQVSLPPHLREGILSSIEPGWTPWDCHHTAVQSQGMAYLAAMISLVKIVSIN